MHLGDPPLPRPVPHEMHDHRERGRQLAVQSHPVETGRGAQRLQPSGDMLGGIGVDGVLTELTLLFSQVSWVVC